MLIVQRSVMHLSKYGNFKVESTVVSTGISYLHLSI